MKFFPILATTLLVSALAAHVLPAAHAAGSIRDLTPGWAIYTTDKGCILYAMNSVSEGDVIKSVTWSGECQRGQPITGTGTLTLLLDSGKFGLSCPVVAGYWHGIVKRVGSNYPLPHNMGCLEPATQRCRSTMPSQVPGLKPLPPEANLTIADIEVCRPEIEEAHRLYVADQRRIIAGYAAEVQRGGNAEWVKYREGKRKFSQEYLDKELQKDPMERYAIQGKRRSAVITEIKAYETEVRLLREDPGGDQIRNIVGVTFTRETATPRIAAGVAALCTLNVALAQLDRKPRANSK